MKWKGHDVPVLRRLSTWCHLNPVPTDRGGWRLGLDGEGGEMTGENPFTEQWRCDEPICMGRHFARRVKILPFAGGAYVKMCRQCYAKSYPGRNWDELDEG
jgi:hypothetical protein